MKRLSRARPLAARPSLSLRSFAGFSTFPTLHKRASPPSSGTLTRTRPQDRDHEAARTSSDSRFDAFQLVVQRAFKAVLDDLGHKRAEQTRFGLDGRQSFDKEAGLFSRVVQRATRLAGDGITDRTSNPLFWSLRHAFVTRDLPGLRDELRYAFQNFLLRAQFSPEITALQRNVADLRFPFEWFPATRAIKRTIHLHVGPTNSGKTYTALKALENARSGIYAGPLRLLAHEIYARLTAKGKTCALLTGEEERVPNVDRYYISCTVEMTPLNRLVDVAVIDEIQMMGNHERGSSWVQALLGVQAREVHLCGEERTVDLIQSLCSSMGDECIVHRYERLSPLRAMTTAVGRDFAKLEKGDAVVAFSRVSIHALKRAIETKTGRRCAVVYGSLPPETRAQQAALFNDPDNEYDFLVASDAIGMGLNLEIKRVVFESTTKHDGFGFRELTVPETKQIGGRAGRYRTARQAVDEGEAGGSEAESATATLVEATPSGEPGPATMQVSVGKTRADKSNKERVGYVTCMDNEDLATIQRALKTEPPQMTSCVIIPPAFILERFAACFPPNTPLRYILMRIQDIGSVSSRFQLVFSRSTLENAAAIDQFKMPLGDRLTFLNAPTCLREVGMPSVVAAIARAVAERQGGHLLDIKEIELELLDVDLASLKDQHSQFLHRLETMHKAVSLYLWLSYRFAGVLQSQALAFHVRSLVEERINECLLRFDFRVDILEKRRARQRQEAQERHRRGIALGTDEEGAGEEMVERTDEVGEEGPGRWEEEGHGEPLVGDPQEIDELVASKNDSRLAGEELASKAKQG